MVATRSQTKEILNRIATELYDALVVSDWARAQSLLQQIPEGEHLPRVAPGCSRSLFIVALANRSIPLDVFRSVVGSFENLLWHEDWMQGMGTAGSRDASGFSVPIFLSVCQKSDLRRLEILIEACPEALFHETEGSFSIMRLLFVNSSPDDGWSADAAGLLLRTCPELKHRRDSQGLTFFHREITTRDHVPLLKAVIDAEPGLLEEPDTDGWTALHFAATFREESDLPLLEFIIGRSSNDAFTSKSKQGHTPLHVATVQDKQISDRIIDRLVEACPLACHTPTPDGDIPLVYLVTSHRDTLVPSNFNTEEMVRLTWLGNCAWALFTALPAQRRPRLHSVLRAAFLPMRVTPSMLCASLTELNQRDNDGNLPIHILANRRPEWDDALLYTMAVKTIIHLYPEACRLPDAQGRLPLELMKRAGHSLRHGMDPLLRAHPAAAMDLGMDHVSLRFLFAQVGRVETDSLYRFLQGAPETIKTVDDAAQGKRRRRRRGG